MIVDNISFSGKAAYLTDANGNIDLSGTTPVTGSSPVLGKGIVIDVTGINMLIEGDDLYGLLRRGTAPIMKVELVKEMFPGLFKDPYRHRVHLVSGYDDFNRGRSINCRVMDVEGYSTLVSTGTGDASWTSEIYRFDQMQPALVLNSAAWDLASPRLVPKDGFTYSISLHTWKTGSDVNNAPDKTIKLADNLAPDDNRFTDNLEADATDIFAFQLMFTAKVNHDSYLKERFEGRAETANLGRPLLRSVSLLEPVAPLFDFYSLHELLVSCPSYHYLEENDGNPKRVTAALSMTAALESGEQIRLHVLSNKLTYVEAKLNARVRIKPPVIDK